MITYYLEIAFVPRIGFLWFIAFRQPVVKLHCNRVVSIESAV